MKKSIALAALLLVAGTSVFAAAPAKLKAANSHDEVSFVALKSDDGFGVQIEKETAGKSVVIIYDNDNNEVFKDMLTKGASGLKSYMISNLDNGDYTVEVVSKNQTVKKQMHIYEEGSKKTYFFFQ